MEFVTLDEARGRSGLRLVVVGGVPSPWGESAKGILLAKRIPYVAVHLNAGDPEMLEWTGQASAPVAIYAEERPRGGWAEILLLAERLAPEPRLVPADPAARADFFGLAHEICGEMGLGWCRRLAGIADGLAGGSDGFPKPVAEYLAPKYGYHDGMGSEANARVRELLALLASRLHVQQQAGSGYYLGRQLTALDIYSACFTALFAPLPHEQCPMPEMLRKAFTTLDAETEAAFDPILVEHRDRIYRDHLELPLSL